MRDLSLLLESQLLRMAPIDVPFVALGTIQGGWTVESLVLFLVAIEAQNMMLRQRRQVLSKTFQIKSLRIEVNYNLLNMFFFFHDANMSYVENLTTIFRSFDIL